MGMWIIEHMNTKLKKSGNKQKILATINKRAAWYGQNQRTHIWSILCFCSIDSMESNFWFAVIKVQCSIERKLQYNRIIQYNFNTLKIYTPMNTQPPLQPLSGKYSKSPTVCVSLKLGCIILKIFTVRWFFNIFPILISGKHAFVEIQKCG